METITASIVYPLSDIEDFADRRGYFSEVPNPAFEESMQPDGSMTDNGEPRTIPNPQSRLDFIKELFVDVAVDWFGQDIETTTKREALEVAKTNAEAAKASIKSAITIS